MQRKVTRLQPGLYEVYEHGVRAYEVERYGDADWLLFAIENNRRVWINDYATKAAALDASLTYATN